MAGLRRNKHKKPYTPPTAATVNPNAATAAVSAFNLSSAAASAALRALPTPPTNVATVQTKRTTRRSASVSSQGSRRALSPVPSIKRMMGLGGRGAADGGSVRSGAPPPTLRRRGSTSSMASMASVTSMSERTFRSPSPGRVRLASAPSSPGSSIASSRTAPKKTAATTAATAAGAAAAAAVAGQAAKASRSQSMPPPPVPSIPKHVIAAAEPTQTQSKQQQKRKSLVMAQQPLRLASQQQKERASTGRASWFGGATVGNLSNIRTSDVPMDIRNYSLADSKATTSPDDRPSSRSSSVNFSYPSRQRLASPPASPTTLRTSLSLADERPKQHNPPPAATKAVSRSMSTERPLTQHTAPRQKLAANESATRRSVSMSRVMDRTTATHASGETLVYDPNSRRFVPRAELLTLEQAILEADERSERQQRKKQQRHSTSSASLAGSHLAQGTMAKTHSAAAPPNRSETNQARRETQQRQTTKPAPPIVAVASPPPSTQQQKQQRRPQKKQQQPTEPTTERDFATPAQPTLAAASSPATSKKGTEPTAVLKQRSTDGALDDNASEIPYDEGRPALVKRPSIVQEEPELEEEEKQQQRHLRPKQASAAVAQERKSSTSPARTAPISSPDIQGNANGTSPSSHLAVRHHSPPPRSISPRKSAMKHPGSPRDVSPSDSASDANPSSLSLPLNYASAQAAAARKKAHRVSFDEKAVVVPQESNQKPTFSSLPGAPESPARSNASQSPSSSQRRTWFSNIGRSKKKGVELAAAAAGTAFASSSSPLSPDEDDEIMKPRPALPSFGSVREKAPHQHAPHQEERPLIRPKGPVVHAAPSPVSSAGPPTDTPVTHSLPPGSSQSPPDPGSPSAQPLETLGTSSDHAIGTILTESLALAPEEQAAPATSDPLPNAAAAPRNTANTSRYREPLPPVVTSVDGSGYVSDSGTSSTSKQNETEDIDAAEHSAAARFDETRETRETTYPTVLPAVIDELPSEEEDVAAAEASTSEASPAKAPKKAVPAIAITNPSQENLVIVQGEEGDEDEQDGPKQIPAAGVLVRTPAPPPTRTSPVRAVFDVPGTFPDSDSDRSSKPSPTKPTFSLGDNTSVPLRQDTFEPISQDDDSADTAHTPATVFATHMPTLHEESSFHGDQSHDDSGGGDNDGDGFDDKDDDSSIYSDAYEDLSDLDGDGFQSLDAVVESPIVLNAKVHAFALPPPLPVGPPSPKTKDLTAARTATTGIDFSRNSVAANAWQANAGVDATDTKAGTPGAGPETGDADWEKVRAFWHSLSSERRAQLEREANEQAANEDAAADGDLEEPTAAKKARRKKSAETRLAEKKALKAIVARNEGPQPQPPQMQRPTHKKISKRMRPSMREAASGGGGGGAVEVPLAISSVTTPAATVPARVEKPSNARPVGHTRTMSSDSASSSLQQKPKQSFLPGVLRRRGSDSSESSFKRSRAGSSSGGVGGAGAGLGGMQLDAGMGMKRTLRGESLDRQSSRFSLRSLSPAGSTTLRGGPAASLHSQSPQMPRTLREKSAGGGGSKLPAAGQAKKQGLAPSMTSSTLRSHSVDVAGGGNRLFGVKTAHRSSGSRFADSSDEDEDIFNTPRTAGGGGLSSANGVSASRRSASVGGVTRVFRSRFDDSSDEDEIILDSRIRAAARQNRSTQRHVVPKTLRSGGLRGSSSAGGGSVGGGMSAGMSLRSQSQGARPRTRGSLIKSPSLPEAAEEDEEEEMTRRMPTGTAVRPDAYMLRTPSGNIGTSTLRRSRSGRGQIVPAAHSPTLPATTMGTSAGGGGGARTTLRGNDALQSTPSSVQHRRLSSASSIMSVLRRKKPKDDTLVGSIGSVAPMKIQRGDLSDSAVRRDTQLERSRHELEVLRSNSRRRRQRQALQKAQRSGQAGDDDDLDSDLDDDEVAGGSQVKGAQASDSWPLASGSSSKVVAATKNGAGANGTMTADDIVINDSDVDRYLQESRVRVKKKKFPALRRMFRLDD